MTIAVLIVLGLLALAGILAIAIVCARANGSDGEAAARPEESI